MPTLIKKTEQTGVPAIAQVLGAVNNRLALATNDIDGISDSALQGKYAKYVLDPVGFIWDILGVRLVKDARRLCESVVHKEITLARSANGVGKTHVAAHLAVWFFLVYPESKVYLFAAPPESNLKRLLWGEVGKIWRQNPHLFEGFKVSMASMEIQRHEQSYIAGLTIPVSLSAEDQEARFSGKHAPQMFFCGDEADAIPGPVFKGIESCASGGHVRQLYNFNPRQQSGTMAQMEEEKRANVVELSAFRHPNVITGKDIYPGATTRKTTVRRINMWTRPLFSSEKPDGDCFPVPNYLVGTTTESPAGVTYEPLEEGYRKIVVPQFSYMVLGKYPSQSETQLFSRVLIDRAFENWNNHVRKYGQQPPTGIFPTGGQDVAEFGADNNVLFFRYDWFMQMPETWNGVDVDLGAKKCAELSINVNARKVNVDSNGIGAAFVPAMRRHYGYKNGVRIMVQESAPPNPNLGVDEVQGESVRDEMCWSFREWLVKNPLAALPPLERLREEMLAVKYSLTPKGKVKITDRDTLKEVLRRSPDLLMAAALTFAKGTTTGNKVVSSNYIKDRNKEQRRRESLMLRRGRLS